MAKLYMAFNGAAQTVAAPVKVTTGTVIKTLMQIATPSTGALRVKEWGISFDGSAAATPVQCELIQTDVAATVTAYGASDITKFNDPNAPTSEVTLGVAASGFTATAEGTITAVRTGDVQLLPPTGPYVKQFPLGNEFEVPASKFLRIRVTSGTAVNATCYIVWEE